MAILAHRGGVLNCTDLEKSRLEWKLDGVPGAGVTSIRERFARTGLLRESYSRFPRGSEPALDAMREDISRSDRQTMMPAFKRQGPPYSTVILGRRLSLIVARNKVILGWLFLGVGGALVWAFLHWVVFQASSLDVLARIGFTLLGWIAFLVVSAILFFIARLGNVGIAFVGVIVLIFILSEVFLFRWLFTSLLTGWVAWANVGDVPLGAGFSESFQAGVLVARESTGTFFIAFYLAYIMISLVFLATRVTLRCYNNLSTEPFSYRFLVKSRDLFFIALFPVFALARLLGNKSDAQGHEKVRHS